MKFEDAIKKSITSFMAGKMPPKLQEMSEDGLKYTPEYFDEFAEKLASRKTDTPKKGKKEEESLDEAE